MVAALFLAAGVGGTLVRPSPTHFIIFCAVGRQLQLAPAMATVAYAYLPTAVTLGGHDGGAPGLVRGRWGATLSHRTHDAVAVRRLLGEGRRGARPVGGEPGHPARVRALPGRGG